MKLVKDMNRTKCHDCGVEPGEYHKPGCDTERCPKCNGQLISCGCFVIYDNDDSDGRWDSEEFSKYEQQKWTGVMYEEEHLYAEENDLWVRWDKSWMKCDKDYPGATHDLNSAAHQIFKNFKPRLKK